MSPPRATQLALLRSANIPTLGDVKGGVAKAILRCIDDHGSSGECWASINTLVDESCFSRRTVIRAVHALREANYLFFVEQHGRTTSYRVNWDKLQTSASATPVESDTLPSTSASATPPYSLDQCQSDTSASAALVPTSHLTGASQSKTSASATPKAEEAVLSGRESRARLAGFDPSKIELPAELSTDAFRVAWSQWCEHRREVKKPLTPTSASEQIKKFTNWGVSRAVAAIRHTIFSGWQGIREPDESVKPNECKPDPAHRLLVSTSTKRATA